MDEPARASRLARGFVRLPAERTLMSKQWISAGITLGVLLTGVGIFYYFVIALPQSKQQELDFQKQQAIVAATQQQAAQTTQQAQQQANSQAAARQNLQNLTDKCSSSSLTFFNNQMSQAKEIMPNIEILGTSYTNHYNQTLNKCFIDIKSVLPQTNDGSVLVIDVEGLYDVYDNSNIMNCSMDYLKGGSVVVPFNPANCWVAQSGNGSHTAVSIDDFNKKVSSYMNN